MARKSSSRNIVLFTVIIIVVGVLAFVIGRQNGSQNELPSLDNGGAQPSENPGEVIAGNPGRTTGSFFEPGTEFKKQNVLRVQDNVIAIGIDCKAIVAETSPERAEAIQSGLAGTLDARPNVYDNWAVMLDRYQINYEAMTMYAATEDAYLTRAYFSFGEHVLDLDMRPSDAMALALRTNATIYLNTTLLDERGQKIC